MPKKRTYRIVGHKQLDEGRITGTMRQPVPASSAATFRCLEDGDAWPVWLEPVSKVTWTSPKPFGVGTTRDIEITGGVVTERFYLWEDGEVMGFHFESGPLPVFDAFAEEWRVIATGDDSCELEWRYGIDLAGPLRYLSRFVGGRFAKDGQKSLAQFADFMLANRATYEARD